jgi:hypothetical protein
LAAIFVVKRRGGEQENERSVLLTLLLFQELLKP